MATLRERIDADLKDAMRSKNELTLSVLRMLKSSVKYKEVEPGATGPLDDAGILQVIATLIKQRRDSVEQFKSGGRADLAEKEEGEISVLQNYLPQQLSTDELGAEVQAAIAAVGAKGPKDMGAVMKAVQPKVAGRAEGRAVSEAVKAALAKLGG
ncbi:GatB/YqeY domain-containing protein [Myxococcaceae bacterium GXIMD 01537]